MSMLSKTLKSKTTKTVAGSTAASGGLVVGLLTFLRATWPDKMPWEESLDADIVAVVTTVVAPVVSRLIAGMRGKL